jgi:hypothetical protein
MLLLLLLPLLMLMLMPPLLLMLLLLLDFLPVCQPEHPCRYQRGCHPDTAHQLTCGCCCCCRCCRTSFLFDNLNIPAVINEAAIQTLLTN